VEIDVAATYFPTCVPGSIIGPLELNGRVRDGNGCGLQGITATSIGDAGAWCPLVRGVWVEGVCGRDFKVKL
jgi:hypothetical protein